MDVNTILLTTSLISLFLLLAVGLILFFRKPNYHDLLTGLINRWEFQNRIQTILLEEKNAHTHILCFFDLDQFKLINNAAGYVAGDKFIVQVSEILKSHVQATDILSRWEGDVFAAIFRDIPIPTVLDRCESIIDQIKNIKFYWEDNLYQVGVSVGIHPFSAKEKSAEEVIIKADVACFTAKQQGGNHYSIYDSDKSDAAIYHKEIKFASTVKGALESNKLVIFAHEARALNPDKLKNMPFRYYELLLRLTDGNKIITPSQFIAAAERYNLMTELDAWMIKKVLIEYGEKIASIPHLAFTINVSANSINAAHFAEFLSETLRDTPIPPARFGFELTETAVVSNLNKASELLKMIQKFGSFVALDDFGTGLSSFNYLKHCPVKFVKIDGSFVKMITKSQIDKSIVESINDIAHKLGALTIAEYVENEEILQMLKEIGVDYVQGYAVNKEIPLEDLLSD